MTSAEVILWKKLSRKQMLGYKFRRQVSIGKSIVDFYCPKIKLAIEVDGDLHYLDRDSRERDERREKFIGSFGIKFLRFNNIEIYKNIDGVLRTIESTILKSKFNKPPLKSPPS